MVALITPGQSTDRKGRPFRRRRPAPFVAMLVVLALVGIVVWVQATQKKESISAPIECPPPPATSTPSDAPADAPKPQPVVSEPVDSSTFLETSPAALKSAPVQVLNGSSKAGQASTVHGTLESLGFTFTANDPYADDPVYWNKSMSCHGQIRLGYAGRGIAAALWVAVPCAQLINDRRTDNSATLALGNYFQEIDLSADAEEVLRALNAAAANSPDGGADPALVRAVHDRARC